MVCNSTNPNHPFNPMTYYLDTPPKLKKRFYPTNFWSPAVADAFELCSYLIKSNFSLSPMSELLYLSLTSLFLLPLPQPAVTATNITQQRPISQNKENTTFLGCFQHQTTQGGEFSLLGFDFSSTSDIYSSPWNHYLVYVLRNIFG